MRSRVRFGFGSGAGVGLAARQRVHPARTEHRFAALMLGELAILAALVAAVFPFTPGFSTADAVASTVAAAVTAAVALAVIAVAEFATTGSPRPSILFTAAVASVGAGTVHLAVLKAHFEEYTLFGLFFVATGLAQLGWAIWLLLRPSRALLWLGVVGNVLIAALWAVDRIWGLPIGPTPWKPDPFGFGDTVTAAFELLITAAGLAALRGRRPFAARRTAKAALLVTAAVVTTLALLSVIGVGSTFLTPTM